MYHYVRDLKHSKYPKIKGLDVESFKRQIQYLKKDYKLIRMEECIEAIKNKKKLPDNAALLTFDDGYVDHFKYVFPILNKLNIQGSFFPSVKPIEKNKVLNVNKIHFILASAPSEKKIIVEIYSMLNRIRAKYFLKSNEYYYKKNAVNGVFDTNETVFIKKMLQKELPDCVRDKIISYLFNKYVSSDEGLFSRNLYMSMDQLLYMKERGMYIGGHGYNHDWLDILSEEECKKEIDISLKFIKTIGYNIEDFVFCYPYGAYNKFLLSLLKEKKCCLALTTKARIADLNKDNPLALPRLDTNDLPKK